MLRFLRRFACLHRNEIVIESDSMYLRCSRCGRTSSGWTLSQRSTPKWTDRPEWWRKVPTDHGTAEPSAAGVHQIQSNPANSARDSEKDASADRAGIVATGAPRTRYRKRLVRAPHDEQSLLGVDAARELQEQLNAFRETPSLLPPSPGAEDVSHDSRCCDVDSSPVTQDSDGLVDAAR